MKKTEDKAKNQSFDDVLNELLLKPNSAKLEHFFQNRAENYRTVLFNCSRNSYGIMEKDVIIAKVKILRIVYQKIESFSAFQLEILAKRLKPLTKSIERILKNIIISLCSQIIQLKNKLDGKKLHVVLVEALEEILGPLVMILRAHIVLKQLSEIKNGQQIQQCDVNQNLIRFSHKHISAGRCQKQNQTNFKIQNKSEKYIEKQKHQELMIKKLYNKIKQSSLQQLMIQYLKCEETGALDMLETCRICLQRFKIQTLQKHVAYCSKKFIYKNRLDDIKKQKQQIISQIQQYENLSNYQVKQSQRDIDRLTSQNERKKIYHDIINYETRPDSKRMKRTNTSANNFKSNFRFMRISSSIDEYHQNYPKNQVLSKYISLNEESELLKMKIIQLESILIYDQCNESNYTTSSHGNNSVIANNNTIEYKSFKTKKSLFGKRINSINTEDLGQTKKFKSIKISVNNLQGDEEQVNEAPICKSMVDIILQKTEQNVTDIKSKDFQFIKILGEGAFGKVYLVRRRKTEDLYAIKIIKIQKDWGEQQLKLIQNQHEIFKKISSEYLVTAPFSYTEGTCHFFVMEYVPGGDLAKVIEQQVYFDEEAAKFYLAEITLAIEALHKSGIIHRDLKPENLVIDEMCHLKLTDFGLSQIRINDKINKARKSIIIPLGQQDLSQEIIEFVPNKKPLKDAPNKIKIIGTPDYIAPEVIKQQSLDNPSIDWWSLGVIAYQMLIGCRPFSANTVEDVLSNITGNNIQYPIIGEEQDMISPVAANLIKGLLTQNRKERLGNLGALEVKSHPFFKGINWESLKELKPPIEIKIENLQKLKKMKENQILGNEIRSLIKNKSGSKLKLQKFVRYDILISQTFESVQKIKNQHKSKVKQLKSIANGLTEEWKGLRNPLPLKSCHPQVQFQFLEWKQSEKLISLDFESIDEIVIQKNSDNFIKPQLE